MSSRGPGSCVMHLVPKSSPGYSGILESFESDALSHLQADLSWYFICKCVCACFLAIVY